MILKGIVTPARKISETRHPSWKYALAKDKISPREGDRALKLTTVTSPAVRPSGRGSSSGTLVRDTAVPRYHTAEETDDRSLTYPQ